MQLAICLYNTIKQNKNLELYENYCGKCLHSVYKQPCSHLTFFCSNIARFFISGPDEHLEMIVNGSSDEYILFYMQCNPELFIE